MTESAAIDAIKNGDYNAIEDIIDVHQTRVYNAILHIVQNENDAEELTQDVFIKVVKNISSFKGASAFGTWVYRIGVNEALSFLRKKKAQKRWGWVRSIWSTENTIDPSDFTHPGTVLENKEATDKIFAAVAQLPERQKAAFTLRYIDKLSQSEVAIILNCNESTLESLIQRAKIGLRKTLTNKS